MEDITMPTSCSSFCARTLPSFGDFVFILEFRFWMPFMTPLYDLYDTTINDNPLLP